VSTLERQAHWQNVYQTKGERAVSWFQERPDISLDLIHATGVDASVSIIDIGGGASRLVDALISEGFKAVAVLDLSEKALATSKARLGAKGTQVQWIVADVTNWQLSQTCDVWHDRAALHFLTDPKDRFLPIRKTVLHTPSAFPKQCASAAT
jgi:trans-aconitate methyltransferase